MTEKTAEKVTKSEVEWKKQLTPEQYHVAREAGTECAFTGAYWNTKDAGMYHCVCCGAPLFCPAHSETSRTLQPAATRIATKLGRRPWKVMLGIPARMTAGLQTRRLNRLRARGPPRGAVKTNASGSGPTKFARCFSS